ncbi:MAG: M56 family metallopeptidase [Hespellia sp.]|nr:M56 family metallopeptidase [Hespellia sp.]
MILKMSLSAITLIILIVLFRAIFMNNIPRKTFSFLWGLTIFKLLIPFRAPIVFKTYMNPITNQINDSIMGVHNKKNILQHIQSIELRNPQFLCWIWGIGLAITLLYFLINHRYWIQVYKEALPINDPIVLEWKSAHKLKRTFKVLQLDKITSPLTYRIFQPIILLPKLKEGYDVTQMNYILTHEYMHIKRFDVITKILLVLCICVHWFNPFVWVVFILANRDIERACDEGVIKEYGIDNKKSYALTILEFATPKTEISPFSSGFSRKTTEERIISIMKSKRVTQIGVCSSILIIFSFLLLSLSNVSASDRVNVQKNSHQIDVITDAMIDETIPTVTLRENQDTGKFDAVVKDEDGNIIYKENQIEMNSEDAMNYIYDKIVLSNQTMAEDK